MANTSVKFGLKPINGFGGTTADGVNQYFIKSDASAIFQGSPVVVELTGGTIAIGDATGDTKQYLGVFAAFFWFSELLFLFSMIWVRIRWCF